MEAHVRECATKGTENQWVQVPPEHVSVQLGSYPGGEGEQSSLTFLATARGQ